MIDESFELADILDKERSENKLRSTMHGLPISLKNNFQIKNYDTSLGMVTRYNKLHQKDSLLVKVFKEKGCIPFIKTNLPIASLGNESKNFIYGNVINPINKDRSPGGSSGGESVAVKTGCSPLGFCSDVGGSARTPALYVGVTGFKFGPKRMTIKGISGLGLKTNQISRITRSD